MSSHRAIEKKNGQRIVGLSFPRWIGPPNGLFHLPFTGGTHATIRRIMVALLCLACSACKNRERTRTIENGKERQLSAILHWLRVGFGPFAMASHDDSGRESNGENQTAWISLTAHFLVTGKPHEHKAAGQRA
jgi:hypothetical protein